MPVREVLINHLELTSPADFRPAANRGPELAIQQARQPSAAFARFLYTAVGGDWYWVDRLGWTEARWLSDIGRDNVELWVAYLEGTPAGYYQLESLPGRVVDINYFGMMPFMTGRGSGGYLLSEAIRRCYTLGAERVTVNTCSLDHPAALNNYLARGFARVREERIHKALDERAPGPWPGHADATQT